MRRPYIICHILNALDVRYRNEHISLKEIIVSNCQNEGCK